MLPNVLNVISEGG